MAQRIDDGLVSVDEYLEMEERSEVRHELVGGMLYAMVGGTDRHNRITLNVASKLLDAAEGGPCRVYISDMRLRIGNNYYYPDVMVACEPPETENPIWRTNPCLVVEVLSPSSESIDRREKLLAYRSIPTVDLSPRAPGHAARRAPLPWGRRRLAARRSRLRRLHPPVLPRDKAYTGGYLQGAVSAGAGRQSMQRQLTPL